LLGVLLAYSRSVPAMGENWRGPSLAINSAGTVLTTISGIFPDPDTLGAWAAS
jgi:hypothetical protein